MPGNNKEEILKDKFQLIVFDGDYTLPSLDPESTKSILYTAAVGLKVDIRLYNSLRVCTFCRAPSITHKNLYFKSYNEIETYLKTIQYNLDKKLNPLELSESLALKNLVLSKLKPVLEFYYWIEPRNSNEFMNIWLMRSTPMPFNYLFTKRFKERAMDLMEHLYPNETNIDVIKEYVQRAAIDCLSNLSMRLGDKDYFYKQQITTLDVMVYAYIAPFIKVPFPSNEMTNVISMWPNLINLVKRIDVKHFPNLPKGSKYMNLPEKSKTSDDDVSYLAIFILTLSATTLVLGFAYTRGYLTGKVSY